MSGKYYLLSYQFRDGVHNGGWKKYLTDELQLLKRDFTNSYNYKKISKAENTCFINLESKLKNRQFANDNKYLAVNQFVENRFHKLKSVQI